MTYVPANSSGGGAGGGGTIDPSGNANVDLQQVAGAAIALGQAVMASSLPVVVASNQTAIAHNITQVGGAALALGQAVMASSIPVVIASNQSNVSVNVAQVGGSALALGQAAMASSVPVVIASNQTNVGVNVAQVGGSAIALGQAAMASSVPVVLASNQSTINVTVATALPTGSNTIGNVVPTGSTTTGATAFHLPSSAATTNGTNVKASAGTVYNITCSNTNAAVRYLKLYDKATAPTVGTDTPIWTLAIPPNSGGYSVPLPVGLKFANGIGFGMTVNAADADSTAVAAGDLVGFNLAYT